MHFCQKCGVEYIDTAEICSDCQQPIQPKSVSEKESLTCFHCRSLNLQDAAYCWKCGGYLRGFDFDSFHVGAAGEVIQCENCGSNTPIGTEFCIGCGFLFTGEHSCRNHPEIMTGFLCLVCQKPLCQKCGKMIDGKFICREDDQYYFVGNWSIIASDTHQEPLKQARLALEAHEIHAVIKNQMDRVQRYLSGENVLLVPIIQIKKAERILIGEKLLFENVCSNCDHEFNGNPNRCPNCGEEFAF